jgi:hypothetical protein
MDARYNLGYTAQNSKDLAKLDLEAVCDKCDVVLCDIEDGDGGTLIAAVAATHYTEKHHGRGNFALPE